MFRPEAIAVGLMASGIAGKGAVAIMRLEPIILRHDMTIPELLKYYMGKNTDQRQKFIIDNLRVEDDSNIDKLE